MYTYVYIYIYIDIYVYVHSYVCVLGCQVEMQFFSKEKRLVRKCRNTETVNLRFSSYPVRGVRNAVSFRQGILQQNKHVFKFSLARGLWESATNLVVLAILIMWYQFAKKSEYCFVFTLPLELATFVLHEYVAFFQVASCALHKLIC